MLKSNDSGICFENAILLQNKDIKYQYFDCFQHFLFALRTCYIVDIWDLTLGCIIGELNIKSLLENVNNTLLSENKFVNNKIEKMRISHNGTLLILVNEDATVIVVDINVHFRPTSNYPHMSGKKTTTAEKIIMNPFYVPSASKPKMSLLHWYDKGFIPRRDIQETKPQLSTLFLDKNLTIESGFKRDSELSPLTRTSSGGISSKDTLSETKPKIEKQEQQPYIYICDEGVTVLFPMKLNKLERFIVTASDQILLQFEETKEGYFLQIFDLSTQETGGMYMSSKSALITTHDESVFYQITEQGTRILLLNQTQEQFLNDMITFESVEMAKKFCLLNGWDVKNLSMHILLLGLE